jgi:hypothetical protein
MIYLRIFLFAVATTVITTSSAVFNQANAYPEDRDP